MNWTPPSWIATGAWQPPEDLRVLKRAGIDKLKHWLRLRNLKHPVFVVNHHIANALSDLVMRGEYNDAVVQSAISCEALIDGTLRLLLWEEAADTTTVAELQGISISKRLRRGLAVRLPADWDQDGTGAVGEWRRHVADPRNSIVHDAYQASRDEGFAAIEASAGLYRFVAEVLTQVADRYPRATCMILSVEDATQRSATSPALRAVLERQGRGASILEEFNRWWEETAVAVSKADP
jgi:hypothetical protein